ncbi:unnamed protein product [Caenorhabditis brenneri]
MPVNWRIVADGVMRARHVEGRYEKKGSFRSPKELRRHSSSDHPSAMVEDKLVTCGGGHRESNHKFHLSCMMYSRPIARYNSQYLCLKRTMGNLFCHDHVCESCFTDNFPRSALHASLVRAYHKNCQPAGSKIIVKNGMHLPFCYGCADTTTGGLTKRKTCVQSFHKKCNRSHRVKSME